MPHRKKFGRRCGLEQNEACNSYCIGGACFFMHTIRSAKVACYDRKGHSMAGKELNEVKENDFV